VSATTANPAGKLALIDERKRAAALALVREGRMYDIGHVLDEHVPVFPGRYFKQTLVTTAHHANPEGGVGENDVNWITELVSATMQLGTHLDALSHLQMGDHGYGGLTVSDLAGANGVRHLGVETVPQIVTRGWLVDASPLRAGGVIGPEHCLAIDPEPGDAVLFHTGWGRYWDDPDAYLSGEPGPGCELAQWLADRDVALTGCDTWSYGPVPPEDPERPFRVPQILNIEHGVFVVENLNLAELAADRVTGPFALILTHPKLRGATGAWTSPIALI
jgi:kynurenine formamidase